MLFKGSQFMANQYFTDEWKKLNPADKKEYLSHKFNNRPMQIIYLDDEEDHLIIFKEACLNLGLECITSVNAQEILQYIELNKSKIFLIISDYRMPEMDGAQFRKNVLNIAPKIPFVILTGMMSKEIALQGIELKIVAFLEKPYKLEDLYKILMEQTENRVCEILEDYEIRKGLQTDALNLVEQIEILCMEIEQDPHHLANHISNIFRMIHTIKGSSGFVEPKTLHQFSHIFEDSLKLAQIDSSIVNRNLISGWLKANDILKKLIQELLSEKQNEYDLESYKKLFHADNGQQLTISPGPMAPGLASADNNNDTIKIKKPNDLRVSMNLLDELMQTSGELTVLRNIINRTVKNLEGEYSGSKEVTALSELLEEMHKVNSDIQNKITDIRCVSVKQISRPLIRSVRDISRALKKDVEFIVEGEDLRLDNSVMEIFTNCLIHMIRNSMDHGIENTEKRLLNKKSAKGKIHLKIEVKDDKALVTIKDDGAGINTVKIKEKAVTNKLKTADEISLMTPNEIMFLIFESGLSTAEVVTDISGRGVGMSMVKETIYNAGGEIKINSTEGQGSEFILIVPLPKSVLITNGLFVKVSSMTLALPQSAIIRVFDSFTDKENKIEMIEGSEVLRFEKDLLPIVSMSKTLKLPLEKERFLIVLEMKKKKFVIKVDEVMDVEDIVIRPLTLENTVDKFHLYQGTTFLSDGRVGLVLSVEGLYHHLALKINTRANHLKAVPENLVKNQENLIIFSIGEPGKYAFYEKEIIRIESFKCQDIQHSGNNLVVPYLNSSLYLITLAQELFGKSFNFKDLSGEVTVLVMPSLYQKGSYLGIITNEIFDLDLVEIKINQSLNKIKGIKGNIIHKNEIITLLDYQGIMQDEKENQILPSKIEKNAA